MSERERLVAALDRAADVPQRQGADRVAVRRGEPRG